MDVPLTSLLLNPYQLSKNSFSERIERGSALSVNDL
jgi:hypothetical protein